ncbi:MAG: metal-dependent hydrolase [Tissierellia bacterium]|nr:metal-dependent hydrolase [Tissierellia bacterium]
MTGKTHMAIGIVAGLTASADQPLENQLVLVMASVLGSLLPDLDHPKAKLNQKLLIFKNKFYRVLFYLSFAAGFTYLFFLTDNKIFGLLGLLSFFIGISSHRSFTHSIIGFFVISYTVNLITTKYMLPSVYSGFVIGYVLHIIADFFTMKGIQLFYPLKISVSSPIIINTKSSLEDIIFTFLSLYTVFLLYKYLKFVY